MSACSVSCGGGRVLVHYVCKKAHGNHKVEEGFCDKETRPKPLSMECNEFDCPARYSCHPSSALADSALAGLCLSGLSVTGAAQD